MRWARHVDGTFEIRKAHVILLTVLGAKRIYLKIILNWILKNQGVTV
jgi:hypothetical protein